MSLPWNSSQIYVGLNYYERWVFEKKAFMQRKNLTDLFTNNYSAPVLKSLYYVRWCGGNRDVKSKMQSNSFYIKLDFLKNAGFTILFLVDWLNSLENMWYFLLLLPFYKWENRAEPWIKILGLLTAQHSDLWLAAKSVPQRSKHQVLFGSSREQSPLTGVIWEGLIGWTAISVGPTGKKRLWQHQESE